MPGGTNKNDTDAGAVGLVERLRLSHGTGDLHLEAADTIERLSTERERLRRALWEAELEARRFAGFYPEASDGRNSFIMLANKIARTLTNGADQ